MLLIDVPKKTTCVEFVRDEHMKTQDLRPSLFGRPFGEPISGLTNLLAVCVDKKHRSGSYSGRIYHCGVLEPCYFGDFSDLLICGDKLLDEYDGPQCSLQRRSLVKQKSEAPAKPKEEKHIYRDIHEMTLEKGRLFSFYIHINFRQNATWQGQLVLPGYKEQLNFRSALELLHYLHQYEKEK